MLQSSDTLYYKRGQVWWFPKSEGEKSIPYLIVSSDSHLAYGGLIHMVPLAKQVDYIEDTHIRFTDSRGVTSFICCEQLIAKSRKEMSADGCSYMYTVSDEIMEKVSLLLGEVLDIGYKIPNLENICKVLEKLAEKKAKSMRDLYQKQMDETVLDLAIRLDEILDYSDKEPKVSPLVTRSMEYNGEKLDETGVISLKDNFGMDHSKKKKRNIWTDAIKEKFLNDVCMYSEEELAEKYHLSLTSVKQYIRKMGAGK